jgi:hypothetical protein
MFDWQEHRRGARSQPWPASFQVWRSQARTSQLVRSRTRGCSGIPLWTMGRAAMGPRNWRRGIGRFLKVLDAERSLYRADEALAHSQAMVTQNLITLYKALGGG